MILSIGLALTYPGRADADAVAHFERPGQFETGWWTWVPAGDGEGTLNITTLPDAGDGAVIGDSDGDITDLEWQPESWDDVWISLATTTTGSHTLGLPLLPGVEPIRIRAIGTAGRAGPTSTAKSATLTGTVVDVIYVYSDDEEQLYSDDEKKLIVLVPTV